MDRRREKSFGKISKSAILATGIALGAVGEIATANNARIDVVEQTQQKEFVSALASIRKAIRDEKLEYAYTLAQGLAKKIDESSDSSIYSDQIFELSEYFRQLDKTKDQIHLMRNAYNHATNDKAWKKKLGYGEDLARLYSVANLEHQARNAYNHLRDEYRRLVATGQVVESDHLRVVRDNDGNEEKRAVYGDDEELFQTYVNQRLGKF